MQMNFKSSLTGSTSTPQLGAMLYNQCEVVSIVHRHCLVQAGHVAVYGDSNCLDSSHQRSSCYNLLIRLIQYVSEVNAGMTCML